MPSACAIRSSTIRRGPGLSSDAWTPYGTLAASLPAAGPGHRLAALDAPAAWLVMGAPNDAVWRADVEAALGAALPLQAGGVTTGVAARVFWLGPDRWLALDPAEPARLQSMAGAVETSDARFWLECSGQATAPALAALAGRDFGLTSFPPGTATGLRIGGTAVIVERRAGDVFVVAGPVSLAEHVAALLLRALADQPGGNPSTTAKT